MRRYFFFMVFFLLPLACLGAGSWAPLQGTYSVGPGPLSDPIPNSPPAAFFAIEGQAAKAMYDGMKSAKVEKNACGEDGLMMKITNELVCTKLRDEYSCNFGVGLNDGKVQLGYTC